MPGTQSSCKRGTHCGPVTDSARASHLAPLPAAAARTYSFTASSGTTYVFISSVVAAAPAEQACVDIGGHLASYPSLLEQTETEQVRAAGCACPAGSGCGWG